MESCETAEIQPSDHFRDLTKMVTLGSGSKRGIKPEDLPPADDIKKLERRAKTQKKEND